MARKWNNGAKARHRINMSRGKRRPGKAGSEFMLAKGRQRYRVGKIKERKKYKRRPKKEKKKSTNSRKMERKKDRGCNVDSAGRARGISRETDINSSRSPLAPRNQKSMNCLLQGQKE